MYVVRYGRADSSDFRYLALAGGQCLVAGVSVSSSTAQGPGTLTMSLTGDLVFQVAGVTKWHTNTTGIGNKVCMNADGTLAVYSSSAAILWQNNAGGVTYPGYASTQSKYELDFVARNTDTVINGLSIWMTNPKYSIIEGWLSYTKNSLDLWQLEVMPKGSSLVSTDGSHKLALDTGGNLIIYHGSTVTYHTGTGNKGVTTLAFNNLTNKLELVNSAGSVIRSSAAKSYDTTKYYPNALTMQNDGNLVVYLNNGQAIWASNTAGK